MQVLDANPAHVKALYRRGMSYMLAGDFDDARSNFKMVGNFINLLQISDSLFVYLFIFKIGGYFAIYLWLCFVLPWYFIRWLVWTNLLNQMQQRLFWS